MLIDDVRDRASMLGYSSNMAMTRDRLSPATRNQALSALRFLYLEVLHLERPGLDEIDRAKAPRSLPTVLTRSEVRALLGASEGEPRLRMSLA
ncbi:MAG: hypothetical protein KC621_20440 [Myxococcales bacterium]|nr:hypothetical protein [Myxococcales bacterium]